jgi:acyl-CoA hydrolase
VVGGQPVRAGRLGGMAITPSTTPTAPESVLDHVEPGADLIVPLANGEPVGLIDVLEAHADDLRGVRIHQMHALHDRPSIRGELGDHLRHVSYFLSDVTRPAFQAGACELVPNHFSEVPSILRTCTRASMVLAAAAPMDRHGYFSLGVSCDYVAPLIGRSPFFLEVNHRMPRTFGRNQVHVSQVAGWTEVDRPLVEVAPAVPNDDDLAIAGHVAERIPDGATLQVGIGAIPNALLTSLRDHRDLGVHTELLSDGLVDLIERGVVTGTRKPVAPHKTVTTFALGTQHLYDFLDENAAVELRPVDWVNDPRVVGSQPGFVSINATLEVDFLGQCASETLGGRYWSSSGGQADFARGAMYSDGGQGFIVLRSTARRGSVSRIVPRLSSGSVVTTLKNTVDKVVTEWGVAEMRGHSVSERTAALIAVAHPDFRDGLTEEARAMGYLTG